MKRLLILSIILSLVMGYALAEDEDENEAESEGIGLSIGLEAGIVNISKADEGEMEPYLMPMITYEQSFFDGVLDVYAEMDYTFGLAETTDDDGNDVFPQSLYIDLFVGYNLGLGSVSTLSFILENEFDEIIISPRFKEINALTGILTPAVKFTQELGFGELFAQAGVPIAYVQYDKDADAEVGLDFTFGWNSTFGLGIEAKILTLIAPQDVSGYSGFEAIVSYENGPMYFEVETIIPGEISNEGVTITPQFDYNFRNFTFYVKCEFSGIGVDGGDAIISPGLGFKYNF